MWIGLIKLKTQVVIDQVQEKLEDGEEVVDLPATAAEDTSIAIHDTGNHP